QPRKAMRWTRCTCCCTFFSPTCFSVIAFVELQTQLRAGGRGWWAAHVPRLAAAVNASCVTVLRMRHGAKDIALPTHALDNKKGANAVARPSNNIVQCWMRW